jgi:purine-nucleoside phosphorylase
MLASSDLEQRVREALQVIRGTSDVRPRVALTLGSGLGGAIESLQHATAFETASLPHWPRSTVPGHTGKLVLGTWNDVPALAGRSHRYEGYSLDRVTFGVRVMHALGAHTMIFTNAVGAINPEYRPGDLMLATDHINFIGKRGLFTPAELTERRWGRKIGSCYSESLRQRILAAALDSGMRLHLGTLMGSQGPSYETAAEVRMASAFGADVACMSTVHEVLIAAHLGCECASLSCITNRATGLSDTPLDHEEVTEVANRVAVRLHRLLDTFLSAGVP